ncbi:MAG: lipoate--protein ligase [Clostridia bacterium]|nr:lipoate--protein ligase [Clostridia bacterium]
MPNSNTYSKIICSPFYDPWQNLALEEALLTGVKKDEVILYLWQNQHTVVVGKNQNAWKECDWKLLQAEGGKLARRLSGGGGVFHDLGNLNYTFIMPKQCYDLSKQVGVVLNALAALGIQGEYSGRNDLTVNGKKFSGTAFCFQENAAYHHGTLLIDTDFAKMLRYLKVSQEKINSKGIDSVRARVMNLAEIKAGLTPYMVGESLKTSFQKFYGKAQELGVENYVEAINKLSPKYASWQWRFGESPKFDISLAKRFTWGGIEINFVLKDGIIEQAIIYSDAMDSAFIEKLALTMQGLPLELRAIGQSLQNFASCANEAEMLQDIFSWLKNKL